MNLDSIKEWLKTPARLALESIKKLKTLEHIERLEKELEQVKAERDRYWNWIKAMGCETCSGDCGECDGTSGWVWSGEDYNVK